MKKIISMAAILALACAASAQAAVLVGFKLTGMPTSPTPTSAAATTVDTNLTAAPLTRGAGLTPSGLANGFSASDWNIATTSFADAQAAGDFYQLSFSVQPNATASLSSIDSVLRRSSGAAVPNFQFAYSFDGFATQANAGSSFTFNIADSNGAIAPSVDLTSVTALQNIAGGTTVTLRLLAYGSTTTTSTLAIGRQSSVAGSGVANDLAINGTTAVPEPTTLAVVALAGTTLALRRRRA